MRKFWVPVSRLRPTLGQLPAPGTPVVSAIPRPMRISSLRRGTIAGVVIAFGLTTAPTSFGIVTARQFKVVSQPPRIRTGKVITFGPRRITVAPLNIRVKDFIVRYGARPRIQGRVIQFGPRRTNPSISGTLKHGLIRILNFQIFLNVKREVDSGSVDALASDILGTEVTFNKNFKDIDSLTATVDSVTEPYIVIYNFVDAPNPTSFFVFVFDTTGNRVSKTVSWKARGVV